MPIPRESFKKLIEEEKAVPGKGGLMHTVHKLLEQYAATIEELEEMSHYKKKQISWVISKLRKRGLKIDRYFNTEDGKYYYYLGE